jgi:FkbM family methyltransferase
MGQDFLGPIGLVHRAMMGAVNAVSGPDARLRRWASPLYANVLFALSGGAGVPGEINGETYRLDPRYRWRLWPRYEAGCAEFLRARMRPGQCCVDVGANIGIYVLQMARWTAPDGHVIGFEPNPETFDVLQRHVRMNGLDGRVTLVRSAVGRATGTARLFDTGSGSGLSRLGAANPAVADDTASMDVPVLSLDDYVASSGRVPDWILVDVEGYEFDVLAGATRTVRNGAFVVVEMHPHLWPGGAATRQEGERLLADLGRRPVAIGTAADPWSAGAVLLEPV